MVDGETAGAFNAAVGPRTSEARPQNARGQEAVPRARKAEIASRRVGRLNRCFCAFQVYPGGYRMSRFWGVCQCGQAGPPTFERDKTVEMRRLLCYFGWWCAGPHSI